MKKFRIVGLILLFIVIVACVVFYFAGGFNPKGAGLRIDTIPVSTIYIDGEQVGKTPYSEVHPPGEIEIKLVPDSFEIPLSPYIERITLTSGVETIITREFGESEEKESGEIITFEKVAGDEVSVVVVSNPDSAQVTIDGVVKGFAPFKSTDIVEGKHELKLSANGYNDRVLNINTFKGYTLTVHIKLSKNSEVKAPEENENDEEQIEKVTVVKILSTPTGFLRVREDSSTESLEVGRVTPDKTYKYLDKNEDSTWYQIELDNGDKGWVTATYSELIEVEENSESEDLDTDQSVEE